MKKLITGAIAAVALLFGFASCTGPLHDNIYDNEVQPLTIVGLTRDAGNHCVAMTLDKPDGSEQSLKFKLSEDFELTAVDGKKYKIGGKDSWGDGSPNQFKIIPSANVKADGTPDWKVDYGWETDISISGDLGLLLKPGDDYHALLKRGDPGTTGKGPSNVGIDGAIANEEYTIKVKYDAASQSVSVKVEGNSSDPSAMIINLADNSKNFPATDKDGKEIATDKTVDTANGDTYAKVTMEKAGTKYTYQFISKENETLKFTLKNDLAGTFGGTLTDGSATLALNEATATVISVDVKKNYEYKLTVDAKDVTKATLKTETVSMLKNSAVKGNWFYSENYWEKEAKSDSVSVDVFFQYKTNDFNFTVNRIAGSDTLAWGGETISLGGTDTTLTYNSEGKAIPAKFSGLTKDAWYKLTLTQDSSNFVLKASVTEAPMPILTEKASYMWSNVNNSAWGEDTTKYAYKHGFPKFVANGSVENSYYADFSPYDTSVEFGIKYEYTADGDSSDANSTWYGCGATISELDTEVEKNIVTDTNNSKITGLTANANYRLYVTFTNPVTVVLKVVKN